MKKFFKFIALINIILGIDIIFNHLNFDLNMTNFIDEISEFYNAVVDKIKKVYSEHGFSGLIIFSIQGLINELIYIYKNIFNYFIKLLNYIKNKLINLLKDTSFEEVKPLEYPKNNGNVINKINQDDKSVELIKDNKSISWNELGLILIGVVGITITGYLIYIYWDPISASFIVVINGIKYVTNKVNDFLPNFLKRILHHLVHL
jgi:hypothetical protein